MAEQRLEPFKNWLDLISQRLSIFHGAGKKTESGCAGKGGWEIEALLAAGTCEAK